MEFSEHYRMPVISSWGFERVNRSSVAEVLVPFCWEGTGEKRRGCRGRILGVCDRAEVGCSVHDSRSKVLRLISDGDGKLVAYQGAILLFFPVEFSRRSRRIEA